MPHHDPHRYLFHSEWRLDAAPQAVYDVLVDVANYPNWWKQVRRVRQVGERAGELVCRSLLPYDLTFVIDRELEDPVDRVLRARMSGDLTGTSQWTIRGDEAGTVAAFDEDVTVSKRMIRAAGRFVRPALSFNHGLMMRSGEAGLRAALAGSAD